MHDSEPVAIEFKTVEQWASEKSTPDWLFAAAKVGNRWPIGRELSEAEYDAAIKRAAHTTAG